MAKSIFQKLFELIETLGECQLDKIHIILLETEFYGDNILSRKLYRLYHSEGYCVDLLKEGLFNEDTGEFIDYDYDVSQEWEGFDEVDEEDLLRILKKEIKNNGKL